MPAASATGEQLSRFHTLRREQWIPRPLDEVFAFFADAKNLEKLTPSWLGFRILTPGSISIDAGTEIHYRLRLHGLPVEWITRIRRWNPPSCFVDVQWKGPYRLWHHTHRFESKDGGTRMRDTVRYRLPFGLLGSIVRLLVVRRDLERIFDYRAQEIREIFR